MWHTEKEKKNRMEEPTPVCDIYIQCERVDAKTPMGSDKLPGR